MNYINRIMSSRLTATLQSGKSILLLGARQTGKTTLLKQLPASLYVSFIQPRERLRYELDPSALADEVIAMADDSSNLPLVIVDEVQKVPEIMDVVQGLIDDNVAQFILTGSSARKLKHGKHINLLPGRVIPLRLSPLSFEELPDSALQIDDLLYYGSLPEIVTTKSSDAKESLLDAYVNLYLEEEIRTEAIVRKVASFARFLELAASESGHISNYSKLSQIVGVAHTTIAEYYQILEDCLIVERIEPLIKSKTRHKLSKSNRFLFVDMGLRRLAAKEGTKLSNERMGQLFEQLVGLELVRQTQLLASHSRIKYWRDADGPEIDWLIDTQDEYIPIEVKYTSRPKASDAKHLITFMEEYKNANKAFIVCQTPRKMKILPNVYAIPWQELPALFK